MFGDFEAKLCAETAQLRATIAEKDETIRQQAAEIERLTKLADDLAEETRRVFNSGLDIAAQFKEQAAELARLRALCVRTRDSLCSN